MEDGYIKLSRKFFSNMWNEARTFSSCEAWLDLIQLARFDAKPRKESIGGREVVYHRGQLPASLRYLSKRWEWSDKKVRLFLERLKKEKMVTVECSQGMNVITLCNYEEYNDKGTDRGTPKDADNTLILNKLMNEVTQLRAQLGAQPSEQGHTRGTNNNKENKDNNIPPCTTYTPPRKGASINSKAREIFENYFREVYNNDYYWTSKDAGSMAQLLKKLQYQRKQKDLPNDDESVLNALQIFLQSIDNGWILDNFSVTKINSQFNEILTQIYNCKNGKSKQKPSTKATANDHALDIYRKACAERGLSNEIPKPF